MLLRRWVLAGLALVIFGGAAAWAERDDAADYPYVPYDHPAIEYHPKAKTNDAIAQLQAKLDRGAAKLDYDPKWGYLPSLLKHFNINVDSQMLVFSIPVFLLPSVFFYGSCAGAFSVFVAVLFVPDGDLMACPSLDLRRSTGPHPLDRGGGASRIFSDGLLSTPLAMGSMNTLCCSGPSGAISVIPPCDGLTRFTDVGC